MVTAAEVSNALAGQRTGVASDLARRQPDAEAVDAVG
jgi:hypothetical protein